METSNFDLYNAPRIFILPSETTPSFKLKHYFDKLCCRHTKKTTHIIIKSIHSSYRSELKRSILY